MFNVVYFTNVILFGCVTFSSSVKGQTTERCYAPVVCSEDTTSKGSWREITASVSMSTELKNLRKDVELLKSGSDWYSPGNGFMYNFFRSNSTYANAEEWCKQVNGRLASAGIRDDSVRSTLVTRYLASKNYQSWIGYEDRLSEGSFLWSDGGTQEATFWATGETTNRKDCVMLLSAGTMADLHCDANRYFLCEREEN